MIELSIVIVSYNTRAVLRECLASIERWPPGRPYEVIVVDNASTDGSPELVRETFPAVRLLVNPYNAGYGPANNRGVAASRGRRLLFQNSDCLATEGLYDGALRFLERQPRAGILGPRLSGRQGELLQMSWGWMPSIIGELRQKRFAPAAVQDRPRVRRRVARLQRRTRAVDIVAGACMFVRRRTFEEAGGFDENLVFYFEEPDLCRRARRAGWQVSFCPDLEAIHLLGESSPPGPTRAAQIYRQSQVYYYRKHRGWLENRLLHLYLRLKFGRLRAAAATAEERRHHDEILEIIRGERVVDFQSSRRRR